MEMNRSPPKKAGDHFTEKDTKRENNDDRTHPHPHSISSATSPNNSPGNRPAPLTLIKRYDTPPLHVNQMVAAPHVVASSGDLGGRISRNATHKGDSLSSALELARKPQLPPASIPPYHRPLPIRDFQGISAIQAPPGPEPPRFAGDPGLPRSYGNQGSFGRDARLAPTRPQPLQGFANPAMPVNLYRRRVRRLGRYHGIRGVGVLPDDTFDPPPPWREGEPPISPERANYLYDEAYKVALQDDKRRVAIQQTLPEGDRAKRAVADETYWRKRMALIELILQQRTQVYHEYHGERQAQLMQQVGSLPVPTPAHETFYPRVPAASTVPSCPPVPASAETWPAAHTTTGGTRRQEVVRGSSSVNVEGARSQMTAAEAAEGWKPQRIENQFANGGALDPHLVTESMAGALNRYQALSNENLRRKHEIEQQLSSFMRNYHRDFGDTLISPCIPSQGNSVSSATQVDSFGSSTAACATQGGGTDGNQFKRPAGALARPLPYTSPTTARFPPPLASQAQYHHHYQPSLQSASLARSVSFPADVSTFAPKPRGQENIAPSIQPPSNQHGSKAQPQDPASESKLSQLSEVAAAQSPKLGKTEKPAAKKARPNKGASWYAEKVKSAGLPTSKISPEAMQAGEDWRLRKAGTGTEAERNKSPTPVQAPSVSIRGPLPVPPSSKRRRGRHATGPPFDEKVGFRIGKQLADHLVGNGYVKQSNETDDAQMSEAATSTGTATAAAAAAATATTMAGVETASTQTPTVNALPLLRPKLHSSSPSGKIESDAGGPTEREKEQQQQQQQQQTPPSTKDDGPYSTRMDSVNEQYQKERFSDPSTSTSVSPPTSSDTPDDLNDATYGSKPRKGKSTATAPLPTVAGGRKRKSVGGRGGGGSVKRTRQQGLDGHDSEEWSSPTSRTDSGPRADEDHGPPIPIEDDGFAFQVDDGDFLFQMTNDEFFFPEGGSF
ncbi:MAG: hypothetical protein M1837_000815 [Sclerophora amabilis]|nr:MAG: hypothetical protein M1837_000815 [Sclerophora amabilis]